MLTLDKFKAFAIKRVRNFVLMVDINLSTFHSFVGETSLETKSGNTALLQTKTFVTLSLNFLEISICVDSLDGARYFGSQQYF